MRFFFFLHSSPYHYDLAARLTARFTCYAIGRHAHAYIRDRVEWLSLKRVSWRTTHCQASCQPQMHWRTNCLTAKCVRCMFSRWNMLSSASERNQTEMDRRIKCAFKIETELRTQSIKCPRAFCIVSYPIPSRHISLSPLYCPHTQYQDPKCAFQKKSHIKKKVKVLPMRDYEIRST